MMSCWWIFLTRSLRLKREVNFVPLKVVLTEMVSFDASDIVLARVLSSFSPLGPLYGSLHGFLVLLSSVLRVELNNPSSSFLIIALNFALNFRNFSASSLLEVSSTYCPLLRRCYM